MQCPSLLQRVVQDEQRRFNDENDGYEMSMHGVHSFDRLLASVTPVVVSTKKKNHLLLLGLIKFNVWTIPKMYKNFYHYFYDQLVEGGKTKNLVVLNVAPINQRYDACSILTLFEFNTNLISLRLTSIPYN